MVTARTTPWSVRDVPAPDALDADDWLLRGGVEALNESRIDTWGNADHTQTVDDYRAWLADQRFAAKACLVAVRDDADGLETVVGAHGTGWDVLVTVQVEASPLPVATSRSRAGPGPADLP